MLWWCCDITGGKGKIKIIMYGSVVYDRGFDYRLAAFFSSSFYYLLRFYVQPVEVVRLLL